MIKDIITQRSKPESVKTLKALAFSQIFMFILSSFAFAFIIGGMVVLNSESVSADGTITISYNNLGVINPTTQYSLMRDPKGNLNFVDLRTTTIPSGWTSNFRGLFAGHIIMGNSQFANIPIYTQGQTVPQQTAAQASPAASATSPNNIPTTDQLLEQLVSKPKSLTGVTKTAAANSAPSVTSVKPRTDALANLYARNNTDLEKSLDDYLKTRTDLSLSQNDAVKQQITPPFPEIKTPISEDKKVQQAIEDYYKQKAAEDLKKAQAAIAQAGAGNNAGGSNNGGIASPPAPATTNRSYKTLLSEGSYMVGGAGSFTGNLWEGVSWSLTVIAAVETLGKLFLSDKNFKTVQAAEKAAVAGIMTYKMIYGAFEGWGKTTGAAGTPVGAEATYGKGVFQFTGKTWAGIAGIIAAYFVFANEYTKDKEKTASIEFKCMPWQAPNGGSDCNKCNNNPSQPCSEYRCKSLGQSCVLINQGTGQERCIDSSPNDVTSPGIKPDTTVLTKGYKYTDRKDRPPGGEGPAHVRITSNDGSCLKAFTAFDFGIITTDKDTSGTNIVTQPAQCKLDYNHTTNFDEMNYYLDDNNLYIENHTQRISLPGTDLLNKTFPGVKNDGEYTLYIRCKDGNGNENRDEYAVRFCIDKSPDRTAPLIDSTSIASGSPVLYNVDNATIGVYTNEPANCKWSRKDSSYSNMENSMTCSNQVWEMNAELLYTCMAKLTGIKNTEENNFYFRCTDLNNNTMEQSYNFKLIGTRPLNILSTGPNTTLGSSTSTASVNLKVTTDNGYKNGESTCYYSPTGNGRDYISMFETGENIHQQNLDLTQGSYTYYFKCVDAGGNAAYNSTSFSVYIDKSSPIIVRAYSIESKLILATNENSLCSYSTESCNFNISQGTNMPFDGTVNHYTDWNAEKTYYIKCRDDFNNEPNPTQCSMIIRPYSLIEETE